GQARQCGDVAFDQRFFLLASPSFDLTFGGNGILNALERLLEYEADRAPMAGVAIECARLMLRKPLFQAAARASDIVRTIAATQNVYECAHCRAARASFETALRASSG